MASSLASQHDVREMVIVASLKLAASRIYAEVNAGDEHASDDVDLHDDILDGYLKAYVAAVARDNPR